MAWLLPENPAEDYVCVKISIPNTPQDIRNFIGSVLNFCQWFNYERTNTNLASLVADTWLITLNELLIGACMQVRQSTESPCILEQSTDGGETWTEWADITLCVDSEYISNLIATTPALQTVIQNTVIGTPTTGGIQSRIDSTAFGDDECDKDAMYGYSVALWKYINANTIDALQIIDEATNASEQLSKILTSVIPGLELLPLDEVLGWVSAFGEYNLEAYEASITVGLEQQIICDIFCLASNNGCTIDFGTVYQYFIDKMGGINIPTATATLAEWVTFMVIGSYATDRIVYLWSAFQLALAFMGQEFLGLNTVGRYAKIAQAGDPDNDWETLCDECGFIWESDFLDTANIWSPQSSAYGNKSTNWVVDVGFDSVDIQTSASVYSRICVIETDEFDPIEVSRVRLQYDLTKGTFDVPSQNAIQIVLVRSDDTLVTNQISFASAVNGFAQSFDWTGITETSIKQIWVNVRASSRATANYSGLAKPVSVLVEGVGANPFV